MRIFFDTNVWLAAFLTHGTCQELLEYCLTAHSLITSDFVLNEIEEKLSKKFSLPKARVKELLSFIREQTDLVMEAPLTSKVCRDPEDNRVLASLASGRPDCLITGDQDLLVLKEFQGTPILSPHQFWKFEKSRYR